MMVDNQFKRTEVTELSSDQCGRVFQQKRWLRERAKKLEKEEQSALRKMRSRKIEKRGKWAIEKGVAHIKPTLNGKGIDLETALELVKELREVRKP